MSNQVAAVQEIVMMGLELNLIMLKQLTEVSKETKSRYLMPLTSTSSDNETGGEVRLKLAEDINANKQIYKAQLHLSRLCGDSFERSTGIMQ